MTDEEYFNKKEILFGTENIAGIQCTIAYVKKFRWRWFAVQLNTFIIIGSTNERIDKNRIEEFSTACYKYAIKNNKGWPRGLQSAIVSISILKGNNIDDSAVKFCTVLNKKHWSAFEIPVLLNSSSNVAFRFKENPNWGFLYFPYFAKLVDETIEGIS